MDELGVFRSTVNSSVSSLPKGRNPDDFKNALMSIDLKQFYQVFFDEAAEHLAAMEALLIGLDVSNPSMDDLDAIFRAAHSIKGGAGTFGFHDMTEVTHILETLLDKLRKREMVLTDEMVSAFLAAGDVLDMQLTAHRGDGEVDARAVSLVRVKLEELSSTLTSSPPSHRTKSMGEGGNEKGGDKSDKGRALIQSADQDYGFFDDLPVPASAPASPLASAPSPPGFEFFAPLSVDANPVLTLPRNAGRRAVDAPDAEGLRIGMRATDKVAALPQTEASSIRVSVEKVDQLVNLMGELVITQSILSQTIRGEDNARSALRSDAPLRDAVSVALSENLQHSLHQLERNTRDLQQAVMGIRMMPISFVFSRFPRLVRDLANKMDKQVELKTIGESTELDKGLIERISDPLTHLVRNSIDHGIEMPDTRSAAGKQSKGLITLQAFHQGSNIVIQVSDDGAGLSRVRILAKARARGLAVHEGMTDQEVWQLIFAPGFSTAEVVTDVSGRGVGMDVVKRNIYGIGGQIEIASEPGLGTTITLRVPLTLAIIDGMSIAVGDQVFIIPLTFVVESLQPAPAQIKTVNGQGTVVQVRGEYLPLISLHKAFGIATQVTEPERGIVVLLEAEGKKVGLFVDELVGEHQVVLKGLESNYRKVPCVSGATIMGDGRVALILDVAALVMGRR